MFCMDLFFQTQTSRLNLQAIKKALKNAKFILILPALLTPTIICLWLCSFVIGLVFIGTSISFKTGQWLLFFGLSSKLSFKKIQVTQEFQCISSRVVLDKALSTCERKFRIKSLTSFSFFKKNLSARLRHKWNNTERSQIIWMHYLKQTIDSLQPSSILREINECCSQNNHSTHIIVARFKAVAIQDPQDKSSKFSLVKCFDFFPYQKLAEATVIDFF